jgi:hypothetical protein
MLSDFSVTANTVAATTKKSEKERILAAFLAGLDDASLERAAVFFSGSPFPRRDQRVVGVGGATIGEAVAEATARSVEEVWEPWPKYADPGDTIAESFPDDRERDISLVALGEAFDRIAATPGANAKKELLAELFRDRLERLGGVLQRAANVSLRKTETTPIRDAAHVDALFDEARARANEGLVVKDPSSIYTPGRRGKSWLKYKKALATLDCVVTYAQWGNGKRRHVLSDLTFAVLRDGELLNIGKAYSGLTDAEIAQMTELLQRTTIEVHGPVHRVEPTVVLEIAFDRVQESKRHKAGYALRFPRIVRIRDDKTAGQISTIDEVRRIYEGQLVREGEDRARSDE